VCRWDLGLLVNDGRSAGRDTNKDGYSLHAAAAAGVRQWRN